LARLNRSCHSWLRRCMSATASRLHALQSVMPPVYPKIKSPLAVKYQKAKLKPTMPLNRVYLSSSPPRSPNVNA
jgi:hypothetical protein